MRMFLIAMCDIFLILYLTGLAKIPDPSVLTVDDFFTLKSRHEALKEDKEKEEASLQEKLLKEKQEKERLLLEKKEQERLASERLKELAAKKDEVETQLLEEKQKVKDVEESLSQSDAERERIERSLEEKEKMLKVREQLLDSLNEEITAKEKELRTMEASYQEDLKKREKEIERHQQLAQRFEGEARDAAQLAGRMKREAAEATQAAEVAKAFQEKALLLKEEAIKEKEAAEKKAAEALKARRKAEAEKVQALEAMEQETIKKEKAEEKVQYLATTIEDITQDGETAYTQNILPQVQVLNVSYVRQVSDQKISYERELTLLPFKIDGNILVIFPSRQIGFRTRSDQAPERLMVLYQGQKISEAWINKDMDVIAVLLPQYKGSAKTAYSQETPLEELMPVLLSVRNNGDVGLMDKIRGISDNYFIVNRDYLKTREDGSLSYNVKGFRGTGMRGERIIRGDQLIDLNGRLIGIANDADHVLRINSLTGWERVAF